MTRHLGSSSFRASHLKSLKTFEQAETLLRSAENVENATAIGHHCREALQHFVEELVQAHRPPNVETDKAKTVNRLRSIIDHKKENLGETTSELLNALIRYWRASSDLVQRQEHGAQRDPESLVWEDSRRVVFQTLVVMYEVHRALAGS